MLSLSFIKVAKKTGKIEQFERYLGKKHKFKTEITKRTGNFRLSFLVK